ncbi:MAG: Asp-tRNA(Asn)/Glu-tRNA(Gln) amidotransferase subunit GatB [Chitinophagaceae bacterium]
MIETGADKYEAVIGLEVHAQLLTRSKLFSGDSAEFGADPNTHISPITLGYPGTLPKLNKEAVSFAIKIGIACGCEIEGVNYFARKNYFYPDLPKGYQLTQHTTPICKRGTVHIRTADGDRNVQLNRIHLEEDAGKSIHDLDPAFTCVDYNRAGVPLIEIVSEPDLYSGEEAYAYLTELRKLVRYLGICDGNMEEGSMRCDANVSIRLKGDLQLGTKVEVKNLNSIRNVKRAIEYEIKRMIELAENGERIIQQTRSYDAARDTTFSMRSKEEANDYRYFPDPDLPPFIVTQSMVDDIRATLPALPEELISKYMNELHLSEYDARALTDDKDTVDFFETLITLTPHVKAAANWLLGPVRSYTNEKGIALSQFEVPADKLASLIGLVQDGIVNFSIASTRIFPVLVSEPASEPAEIASRLNLVQESDAGSIEQWVNDVLNKMPDKVLEYKNGKKGLIGLFMGEVKKISGGKADPRVTTQLLTEKLSRKD